MTCVCVCSEKRRVVCVCGIVGSGLHHCSINNCRMMCVCGMRERGGGREGGRAVP